MNKNDVYSRLNALMLYQTLNEVKIKELKKENRKYQIEINQLKKQLS